MDKVRKAKGEGSIRELATGKIQFRRTVTHPRTGKTKVFCVSADTLTACKKKMNVLIFDWIGDTDLIDSKLTLSQIMRMHLDHDMNQHYKGEPILKPKSAERRKLTINQIEKNEIAQKKADEIYPREFEEVILSMKSDPKINKRGEVYKESMDLSVSSKKKAVDVINSAYNWAVQNEYVAKNRITPVIDNIRSKLEKCEKVDNSDADVICLSDSDIIKFEKAANAYTKGSRTYEGSYLGLFLLYTGLRIGEALALNWEDWDIENGYVMVYKSSTSYKSVGADVDGEAKYTNHIGTVKTYHNRNIILSQRAKDVLNMMIKEKNIKELKGRIFITKKGRPDTTSNAESKINRLYEAAGINKVVIDSITHEKVEKKMSGCHVLRHTFATNMYNSGVPIEKVAAYIGDSVDVANKYYVAKRKKHEKTGLYVRLIGQKVLIKTAVAQCFQGLQRFNLFLNNFEGGQNVLIKKPEALVK